ncbi:MAG: serine hydrolase domain-containing protein [Planctomycetota bacterium]
MRPLLVPPLLLLLLAVTLAAQDSRPASVPTDVRARIQDRCQAELERVFAGSSFPGGSAALILPDGQLLTVTVGFASVEDKQKMRPADRMLSGSIGKTYVTAAAHHLIQKGKIRLDDKASSYFKHGDGEPDAWFMRLPNAGDFTLRQLLRHQSGLPRYVFKKQFFEDLLADDNKDKVWKPRELLSYVFDSEPLFPAGKGWAYSDTNFIVVGMILERASGMTFYEYVQKHFLAPHRLKDTLPSDQRRIPGLIQGYAGLMQRFGVPERVIGKDGKFVLNPQFEWCGGGFANTPADLARWARILYTGKAMEGPYLKTMLDTVPAARLGRGTRYGLGVMERETPAGRLLGHDGMFPGYSSTMGWFPEPRIAAAFQVNKDDSRAVMAPMYRVMTRLVKIAADELGRSP